MRFIHIADVHLGAVPDKGWPWSKTRSEEIKGSFFDVLSVAESMKVELLLISGDLFHRQPLLQELKEVNYHFGALTQTKVVLMAGNHDYIGPNSPYKHFEWSENVIFFKKAQLESVYLEELNTCIYGLSYHHFEITQALYDDAKPIRFLPDGSPLPYDCSHILLAHGGDEKHIPIHKERLKTAGFNYIALGHIHKPRVILDQMMAYAGALEPIDKNDVGPRGYIQGLIDQHGTRFSFVPYSKRSYKELNIHVQPTMTNGELLKVISDRIMTEGSEDIYKIEINGYRDEDIDFSKADIFGCGQVVEVNDVSIPDYDFEKLYEKNRDNMIGLYIKKVTDMDIDEMTKAKMLCYGMRAMLGSRG